jgi:transforming growth factor-beta-induced protein
MVSKKLFSAVVATAVILSIVGGSTVAFAQATTSTTTITQTAVNTPDLSTLVSFLQQANLTQTLNNTTANYTVLAPTNAAFAKLNNTTTTIADLKNDTPALTQILLNHVINGTVNFTKNGSVTTLAGNSISYTVNGTKVTFSNGATITQANINASNGVIDEISSVLVPPANATTTTASATASGGFLGLPGFEAVYGVVGLLAVAYLVMRRRQ